MKYIIFICIILACGCNNHAPSNVYQYITLNTSLGKSDIDISYLFEDSLEFVKLDITNDCFVRADDEKICNHEYIWIYNHIAKKIFMFDQKGRYIKTIGVFGRGPGEYAEFGGFSIVEDSLFVHDRILSKIIIYPIYGEQFREITIKPAIYSSEFTILDSQCFFITNYSNNYNLISFDLRTQERSYFLPYSSQIEKQKSWWELNKYSSCCQDTILFMLSRNDTIYSLSHNNLHAKYIVHFPQNKIPRKLLNKTGTEILRTALEKDYIYGVDQIFNTKDAIIGNFGEGSKNFQFIYFKNNRQTLLAESLNLNTYGKLSLVNYLPANDNELIFFYDALLLKETWNYILKDNHFSNTSYKEKLERIINTLKDDDNPIMFKLKFKNTI